MKIRHSTTLLLVFSSGVIAWGQSLPSLPAASFYTQLDLGGPPPSSGYVLTSHNLGAPPLTFFDPTNGFSLYSEGQGSYTDSISNGTYFASASGIEMTSPSPSVATSVASNGGAASIIATAGYFLEIVGPTASVPVAVMASGGISTSAVSPAQNWEMQSDVNVSYGPAYDTSLIGDTTTIGDEGDGFFSQNTGPDNLTGSFATGFGDSFTESSTYSFDTNTVYFVGVTSFIFGDYGTYSMSGYVDPTFTIPASTPDASAYTILLSSGISNSVPDSTSTAALLGLCCVFGFLAARPRGAPGRSLRPF